MVSKTREVGIRLSVKDKEVVERALKSLGKEGEQALKRIEASAKPASVSLQALNAAAGTGRAAIGGFVGGAVAGLLPVLTLAGAIQQTRAALEKFGDIADKSKSAGLDSEFFQGLAYQAKLAGVEVSSLSAALDTFNKLSGQAVEGRGRMVSALKGENAELLRNLQLARSQEERLRIAADAINSIEDANRKAAVAAALFGNSGTELVAVFEGGAQAIDATISRARELGIVVDRDVIARADELGDAFDTASEAIDNNLKQAIVNLGPGLVNFAEWIAKISAGVRDLVDAFKSLDQQSSQTLSNRLRDLGLADVQLENRAIQVQGRLDRPSLLDSINRGALEAELKKIAEERERNRAEQQAILDELGSRTPPAFTPPPGGGGGSLPPSDEAKASIREAEALIKRLRTATEEYADTVADLEQKHSAGLISQETMSRGVAEAALKFAKAADDADEYAAALARLDEAKAAGIISEKQYTDAVASLTQRRLVAQNDWLAGVQLGLQQISEGARTVTTEVAQAVTGWADSLGQQIGEVFRTGKFAWQDLVKTMLADIAKLVTQQMITRPLAGLLGGLFGGLLGGGGGWNIPSSFVPGGFYPGFANGTDFAPGGMAMVGERGPELVNLPRGSRVIPNHRLGGTVVNLSPTYNIDGAAGMSPAQLLAVLDQHDRDLMARVSDVVKRDAKNGVFG